MKDWSKIALSWTSNLPVAQPRQSAVHKCCCNIGIIMIISLFYFLSYHFILFFLLNWPTILLIDDAIVAGVFYLNSALRCNDKIDTSLFPILFPEWINFCWYISTLLLPFILPIYLSLYPISCTFSSWIKVLYNFFPLIFPRPTLVLSVVLWLFQLFLAMFVFCDRDFPDITITVDNRCINA